MEDKIKEENKILEEDKPSSPRFTNVHVDENKEELSLDNLKKELDRCLKERADYLAGWQRAQADFLNYKKEQNKRIEEVLKFANLDLVIRLLSILDNFDLMEKNISEELKENENIKGILQIKMQILDFLKSQNLEIINVVIEEKFDPNFHEAIQVVETKDKESDIIVEEIQKGYILQGRVIRPAKVKVTK